LYASETKSDSAIRNNLSSEALFEHLREQQKKISCVLCKREKKCGEKKQQQE